MSRRPSQLIPGDPRHGVTIYARQLAAATGCPVTGTGGSAPLPDGEPLHVHFTDRIWGATPAQAAARIEALRAAHPLSVTLHDLPQASDGVTGHAARTDAYRRVVTAARAVVCNSGWERELLDTFGDADCATVIPLPVITGPAVIPLDAPEDPPTVGLLGWVYPGKGHLEVITAAAQIARAHGQGPRVIALGAVSDGHDAELERLRATADRCGVEFTVTGWLEASALHAHAAAISVPIAAHRHISASGSINTWLSLGRRPLVAASAYTQEMERLRPGTLNLYAPAELEDALTRATRHPASTRLSADIDLRPGLADVAAAYLRFWSETVTG